MRGMFDLALIAIFGMMFAVVLLISAYMYNESSDIIFNSLENSTLNYTIPNAQKVDNAARNVYTFYDKLFLVFITIFFIVALIGAYNINTHPVFFILSVFSFFFVLLVVWVSQYVFVTFATIDLLSSTANDLPVIVYFMDNLPVITSVFFIVLAVVTYAGRRRGSNELGSYY